MKYMGSKRYMLSNGLGNILSETMHNYNRFVDLFAGSSAVGCFVAEQYEVEVLSNDLQSYSAALANGILSRTEPIENAWVARWLLKIRKILKEHYLIHEAEEIQAMLDLRDLKRGVMAARSFCEASDLSIFSAYGGYYFSPLQALTFDICRANLPRNVDQRSIALSAIIQAASTCCAAPGHTAQPFKPNETAGPYIIEAWKKDPIDYIQSKCLLLSKKHAKKKGKTTVSDANSLTATLGPSDLVFLDPPYSGVHYSRFYHVLETLSRGRTTSVSGAGRYPPSDQRPTSNYSMRTTSYIAMKELLYGLEEAECAAILTYPAGETSNGLSGEDVLDLVTSSFSVNYSNVKGRFSTLGGNTRNRDARIASNELLLSLEPKRKATLLFA